MSRYGGIPLRGFSRVNKYMLNKFLNKEFSILSVLISVLILGTITGFGIHFIFAWTGPTVAPPGGNVAVPINAGSTEQTITGILGVNGGIKVDGSVVIDDGAGWHRTYGQTGWYNGTYGGGWYMIDSTWVRSYNNKNVYTAGQMRADGGLCIGTDCRTSWPSGSSTGTIPSGMIAMFDTTCPAGWTRFSALDGRFARGASSYGSTGGADTHTHAIDPPNTSTGAYISDDWYYQNGDSSSRDYSWAHHHDVNISAFNSGSGNNLPSYLNMIYCKKD